MQKIIDIKEEYVVKLKILASRKNMSLKPFIEYLLQETVSICEAEGHFKQAPEIPINKVASTIPKQIKIKFRNAKGQIQSEIFADESEFEIKYPNCKRLQ